MNIWRGKVIVKVPFGHVLILKGKIKPNPNKICVDLAETCTEKGETGTVLLKVEVNFGDNQIIRSMYRPGHGWSQEEISKNCRQENPKNPLVPGEFFIFRITVLQKCFEIYVNDHLYGTFDHLECPNKIKYIIATGDFENIVQFHHRSIFPSLFPRCDFPSGEKEVFISDAPRKYEVGNIVALQGICQGPINSEFSINFICNESSRVFLKFLVKFEVKTVVRTFQREEREKSCLTCSDMFNNTMHPPRLIIIRHKISKAPTKIFKSEDVETCGEFPFKRGKLFRIAFGLGEQAIMIAVNGKYFTYFNFPFTRFSLSTVKCCTNDVASLMVTGLEYHSDTSSLKRLEELSKCPSLETM